MPALRPKIIASASSASFSCVWISRSARPAYRVVEAVPRCKLLLERIRNGHPFRRTKRDFYEAALSEADLHQSLDELGSWRRSHYSIDVTPNMDGREVTLFGWIHEVRDLGGIKFLVLRDSRGLIQITIPKDRVKPEVLEKAEALHKEYVIGVRGLVRKMEKAPRGVEVVPTELKILNIARPPLPLDVASRIPAELSTRFDARALDLRRSGPRAVFKIRHEAIRAIREFLVSRGYLEVHTPKIIATATEGGAALFPLAYYDREAFLAQSPQLYKEQLVGAFEKVFEIGPIFRAEKFHTTRHLAEAISVDIEEAFATAEDVMHVLEELIAHVITWIRERCAEELATLKHRLVIPTLPFERLTYDDAVEELRVKGIEVKWGEDFSTPALRALGRLHRDFYFVTRWPSSSKPFYLMPYEDDPRYCKAFDLMWGWLEVASGGARIHTRSLLEQRLKEQGLFPTSFEHHLKVMDYGMPPHAGWGLGLDRLLLALTGKKNIREVVLYPRDKARLVP